MGKARSKSSGRHRDGNLKGSSRADGNTSSTKSKKGSMFQARWLKFGGSKEWKNGCSSSLVAEGESDEARADGPPVLSIQVDQSKGIDLTERVRQKSDAQITREFALAAREAVKEQMETLKQHDIELFGDECSNGSCVNRTPSLDGPNVSILDGAGSLGVSTVTSGGIRTGSAEFDFSARSMPPPTMKPTPVVVDVFGAATIQEIVIEKSSAPRLGEKAQARDLVFRHSGSNGTLVFVIRRPGCLLCREQALYLKFLFQNYPAEVEGFTFVGVVKEFCDKDGAKMREFHDKYFPFPLYLDIDRAAYKVLGNRKAGLSAALKVFNPFSDTAKRIKKNQITGDLSGEGFLQGGIIIYHRHGMAAYKYEEETGLELPVADIVKGLRSVRRDDFVPSDVASNKGNKTVSSRRNRQLDGSVRTVG